jgi:hypothetical protein
MELNNIITNKTALSEFLKTDFDPVQPDSKKLFEEDHSLSWDEFNRQLRDGAKAYSLLGAPIKNLYAYVIDTGFALYVLMEFDLEQAVSFMTAWGVPESAESKEEVESGNFSFLHWRFTPLDIIVMKDRFAGGMKAIGTITNMKYAYLLNKEPV